MGHNNKKKKRSFNQVLERTIRNKGMGNILSDTEISYYKHLLQTFHNGEQEEKDLLVTNFYENLQENEIKNISMNQLISKFLDETLQLAQPRFVIKFLKVFSEDLRIFCTDPFASHVIQTLLVISLQTIQKKSIENAPEGENESKDEDLNNKFQDFISKTSKFVFNNLSEFIGEKYASHVIRSVIEVCFGIELSTSVKCSKRAHLSHSIQKDPKQVLHIPEALKEIGINLVMRLTQLPQYTDVINNECSSYVLQSALLALSASEESKYLEIFIDHIVQHGFESLNKTDAPVHPLFESSSTSRLMEVVISVANENQQLEIFKNYINDNMKDLMQHHFGNHSIQKFLDSWRSENSFDELFNSVSQHLMGVIYSSYPGVLLAFVKACRRFQKHENQCLKILMSLFEVEYSSSSSLKISQLLVYLLSLENYNRRLNSQDLPPVSLHGTLIVQELLHFQKPIKVVKSILEMTLSELIKIACDPRGSHIIDAFAGSSSVGEKSKLKLVNKLEGHLASLACSKHGSRSLEALWNVLNVKGRTKICQELFAVKAKLSENPFGLIIYNKFGIRFFRKEERESWVENQEKECKKRKFLNDFLQETEEISTSAKKKKK